MPQFIESLESRRLLSAGLEPGTTYSYRVTAFDDAGESAPSNVASATTWLSGDVNQDWRVDGNDYPPIDLHLGQPGDWLDGDMNQDGQVTGDDYPLVDLNLGKTITPAQSPVALSPRLLSPLVLTRVIDELEG